MAGHPEVNWPRRATRPVRVRQVAVGGGAPVSVQTMTKTDTADVVATVAQIKQAVATGADIVRLAIPHQEAARGFAEIRQQLDVPLVADIHFDYRLALAAIEAGADKIRINPGNIGDDSRVGTVVEAAAAKGIPIRVGVNAGSLEKSLLEKHGGATPEAAAESALSNVARLEAMGFRDLVVSIKASDIWRTVQANRLFARESDCPLHLGITEAGPGVAGIVTGAAGVGLLLAEGLGDTIRISLTDPPTEEVVVGRQILLAMGLISGPRLVSCPTCGRCRVDLQPLARRVAMALREIEAPLVVAVMGCEVNGPGEAKEADVGIAAGKGKAILFRKGEVLRTVPFVEAFDELMREVKSLESH
ncbi:MAG: flavodoxin-dependent (E)-4-hydroxy-3-methylbut-2-enyl-diphosphate synthase [Armatimonadetes bacterium]|nr:flavodoxin-dependent (E)-4-hydroxy-3-methylbut-2-enyl-diphosphate synthase [Armatimonadota bacterium]